MIFFFFKQKTAYEMRISDWSSDVCSSDVTSVVGNEPKTKWKALVPIDLDLRKGEFFAVVGPSGCGKSTLFDIVAGLAKATSGQVTFEGQPLTGSAVPDGVGVVFQEDASFPWLTVTDNVAFGIRRAGLDETEVLRRVTETLTQMGPLVFAQAYPAQCCGGLRQGGRIARPLVHRPERK